MKSADFLDALRDQYGLHSDRKLAARLGWNRTRLSKYRTGEREFDDQTCAAVAQKLNVSVAYVMAEIQAERADCTEVKLEWQAIARMLKSISTTAGAGLLAFGLVALESAGKAAESAVCILCNLRDRVLRACLKSPFKRPQRACRHPRRQPLPAPDGGPPMYWRCLACGLVGIYAVGWQPGKSGKSRTVRQFLSFRAHGRTIGRMRARIAHVLRWPLVMTCLIFTGCAGVSGEILIGAKVNDGGVRGHGPTATLRVRKQLTDRAFCEYQHFSFVVISPRDEDWLDHVGCGIRFGGE